MSAAPLLYKLLSPAECADVAKYLGRGSPRSANTPDAGSPVPTRPALSPDHCATCGAGEFALPPERVTVDYSHGIGVWLPCPECRPAQAWAFAIRWRATHAELLVPEGIERRDSWDLPDDELSMTGPLPREVPAYWGRDRGEWDGRDDKADIQPFERTTR